MVGFIALIVGMLVGVLIHHTAHIQSKNVRREVDRSDLNKRIKK